MLAPRIWESKSTLIAHLDGAKGPTVVIARDAEAPRVFASFALDSAHGPREICVISSGLGQLKAVLVDAGKVLLVGHDTSVTWIDVASLAIVASRDIQWSFAEFIALDRDDHVLVIHELGALRVDAAGTALWSFDTPDVVEDFEIAAGDLVLAAMDGTRHRVSLATGPVIVS